MLSLPKLFWFCKFTTPWMFPPLDILREYWIEHVSFGLLYVMFTFPFAIFYREFHALQLIVLAVIGAMD